MTNWNGLPKPRVPSEAGLVAKACTPATLRSFGASACVTSCWETSRSAQSLSLAKERNCVTSPEPTIIR